MLLKSKWHKYNKNKHMKKALIILLAIFILLIGAMILVPILYKDQIIAAAHDAANKEMNATLKIQDLDVSMLQNMKNFPDISLIAKDISIIGKNDFAGDTLIYAEKLAIALDIKTFFNAGQTMKINGIRLSNARINAIEKDSGIVNWDIMKPSQSQEPAKFSLSIQDIALDHVNMNYKSIPSSQELVISNLTHAGKGDFTHNELDYDQSTDMESISYTKAFIPYLSQVKLSNRSRIKIDQAAKKYTLENNTIQLNDLKLDLNGFIQTMTNDALAMNINFNAAQSDFKSVLSLIPALYSNKYNDLEAKGKFDMKGTISGTYYKSTYPKMDIDFNVQDGEFHYEGLPKKVSDIQIKSKVLSNGGSLDNVNVDISKFSMNIGSDPFQGNLKLRTMLSKPYIELLAKGRINLSDVINYYPMKDIKSLSGILDIDADVKGSYEQDNYPQMNVKLDLNNGALESNHLPKKVSNLNFASLISSPGGSMDNMVIDIPRLSMNIGSDPFTAKVKLMNIKSNPYIELSSKGKLNLADIQKLYPTEGVKKLEGLLNLDLDIQARKSDIDRKNYAAVKADGVANISNLIYESQSVEKPLFIKSMNLKFSPQYAELSQCSGSMASMDFKMTGRLENLIGYFLSKDGVLSGNMNFSSPKINSAEFISSEKNTKEEYVLVPKNVDFTGSVNIGEMLYDKMTIKNISGSMKINDEKLYLNEVKAELLNGSATMTAVYNTKGIEKPITSVNYSIQNFDIKQTFEQMESAKKLGPILNYMSGSLSSESDLKMTLLPDMSPDLNSLNGDMSVNIPFTKIVDVPAMNQIAQVTKLSQLNQLELSNVKANLSFMNGAMVVKPFTVKLKDLDMKIQGVQGLNKSINYDLALDIPFSKLGNASSVVSNLTSKFNLPFIGNVSPEMVRLHIKVGGFFDKPTVSLGKPELSFNGKPASTPDAIVKETVNKTVEDVKNKAVHTADSLKNAAINEANRKAEELRKQAEEKANELKRKAGEEVNKKKEDLLNELKKKLPW